MNIPNDAVVTYNNKHSATNMTPVDASNNLEKVNHKSNKHKSRLKTIRMLQKTKEDQ